MVKTSNIFVVAIVVIVLMMLSSIAMAGTVSSYFDTDAEGWGTINDAHGFQWVSDVGNPAGSIYAVDNTSGGTWCFLAPAKFLGNHLDAYGKTLTYDLKISARDTNPWTTAADVSITGNGITIGVYGAFAPTAGSWSSFSVNLDESGGWKIDTNTYATEAQIQSVLSNITALNIRAEFKSGSDNAYLDNVVMTGVVPEPASLSVLIVGILGTATCVFRRRK